MAAKRLIAVNGPLSLLNALSVLYCQKAHGEYGQCDDYLIIGDLGSDAEGNRQMVKICSQIAQVWNFGRISYLAEGFPIRTPGQFKESCQAFKEKIGLQVADAVYTCRNWQKMNELVLGAFPDARKICFGDALGHIDVNTALFGEPENPFGFIPMDDAYLITPNAIEEVAFNSCPITVVDFEYFKETLFRSAAKIDGLSDYCRSISQRFKTAPTIVTTANLTEAYGMPRVREEIIEYLSCVLSTTTEGEGIIVKGHPRQRYNQSVLLAAALVNKKRRALAVSEFNSVPVELFIPFFSVEKAITLNSSCCIPLAYFFRNELHVGMGQRSIERYGPARRRRTAIMYEQLYSILVDQAYSGKFEPLLYPRLSLPEAYHSDPIHKSYSDWLQRSHRYLHQLR